LTRYVIGMAAMSVIPVWLVGQPLIFLDTFKVTLHISKLHVVAK